jgi:hypothetical protein
VTGFPGSLALQQHIHRHRVVHIIAIPLGDRCVGCDFQADIEGVSDFIKAGRWMPAEEAHVPVVNEFKKNNHLK